MVVEVAAVVVVLAIVVVVLVLVVLVVLVVVVEARGVEVAAGAVDDEHAVSTSRPAASRRARAEVARTGGQPYQ